MWIFIFQISNIFLRKRSRRYSHAPDYFEVASKAVQEMFSQVGAVEFDERGMLTKGVIVRHMVMPNGAEDSMDTLTWIAENLPLDDILVSVMSQYTPFYKSAEFPEINRRLTQEEYDRVLDWMECMGIRGWICAGIKFGKRGIYTGLFPSGSVEHVEIITI